MSGRFEILSLLTLCLVFSASAAPQALKSYSETIELDLSAFRAGEGVQVWLSRDNGQTWKLVGRTTAANEPFVYRASAAGLHDFHIHPNRGDDDAYRPTALAVAHARFDVVELEAKNEQILYSNSRRLGIKYEVKDIGANDSGSFQSHLYYTLNSGLSWQYYGIDPDGQSPTDFSTAADGLYGFKVVSVDLAGLKELEPNPGARPDVLVRVDTVAPHVELLSPQPLDLWEAGTRRVIRWRASDESLDKDRGVSLFVSVGIEGSWTPVAANLPAAGELIWTVPESENGRIFMLARAIDRAGNTGTSAAGGPFMTRNIYEELLPPEVRAQADRYYETATICRSNEHYQKAVKYYRLCHQLNPYHVRCHNDLALVLNELGHPDEAFKHFEEGLKYSPSHENLLLNLARMYVSRRQYDVALNLLERLIALSPKSVEALWMAGETANFAGNMESAHRWWKRILDLDLEDAVGQRLSDEARRALFRTDTSMPSPDNRG